MNIYYASGGGLGHLTRARAVLHQFGIERETAILTSSKFADDQRVVGDSKIIRISDELARNKKEYEKFLLKIFADNRIEKFYLDSFPVGIIGEFAEFDFGETELYYIARLLKWKNYSPLLKDKFPRFKKSFVLEKLENDHQKFIENNSDGYEDFNLIYQNPENFDEEEAAGKILAEFSSFWLIVHAGDETETAELLNYAKEMRGIEKAQVNLILISPNQNQLENSFNIYPAVKLFPFAERIFTAGGFNAIQQTKNFRHKHFILPFERRFDDQFGRAKRTKSSYSNRLLAPFRERETDIKKLKV